jgi:hypothetical protein
LELLKTNLSAVLETLVDKASLQKLLERAVQNLSGISIVGKLVQGKMFEVYALVVLLRLLRTSGFGITAKNCPSGKLRLPGAPAIPNKAKYSYFEVSIGSKVVYEVWPSIEVLTLSSQLSGAPSNDKCSYHEVDVGVFRAPLVSGKRPNYDQLAFAASCKYRPISKEQVREALGLRRETGLLCGALASAAPWFVASVPSNPPIPVVLFSKDPGAASYREPISRLGLYVRQLTMP